MQKKGAKENSGVFGDSESDCTDFFRDGQGQSSVKRPVDPLSRLKNEQVPIECGLFMVDEDPFGSGDSDLGRRLDRRRPRVARPKKWLPSQSYQASEINGLPKYGQQLELCSVSIIHLPIYRSPKPKGHQAS